MKKTFKTLVFAMMGILVLASCEDVPAPFVMPDKDSNSGSGTGSTIMPEGDGTLASPYNVAAIVAKIKTMEAGVESTEEYYIKGKVLAVTTKEADFPKYGNHSFKMVDEGNNSVVFTAFQVNGPGKQKFSSMSDIKEGDVVVVCGKVVNYNGNTPETVGKGAAYVVSIKATDNGGQSNDIQHITIAEFLAKADANTTYELTGIVKNIANTTYGNFDLVEGDASIYIYGLLDLQGNAKNFASIGIAEGDEVTLTGKYVLFTDKNGNSKAEIANAQLISFKKGGGSGNGDTPVEGTEITCEQAVQLTNALTDGGTSTESYNVTGYITELASDVSTQKGDPQQCFWMADTKDGGKVFEAYYANVPNGVSAFTVGMKVKITGKLKKYVKSGTVTPEMQNPNVVILEEGDGSGSQGGDGGDQGGGAPVKDLVNGDFEEWVGELPTGWKSASSASSSTVSQSTDARNGNYACKVAVPTGTGNARLATQEITLEAGSYTFSYYANSTLT